MRDLMTCGVSRYRLRGSDIVERFGSIGDGRNGAFVVPSPTDGGEVFVIASSSHGWEHVSVSRKKRCPNWPEMSAVHRWFFEDEEAAMQLHVPMSEHIDCHANCLHIWRPTFTQIPRPSAWMIGPERPVAPGV